MKTIPYPEEAGSTVVSLPQPYTIEAEAKLIVWLSKQIPFGNILEVGCANGYLTKALAEANPAKTVYALDWSFNPGLSVHQEAERPDVVASRALHLPNVIAINGDSKRFDYPAGIGFVFIDGDHSDEGVQADTGRALDYQPSIIAWHDYRPESQWQGVARLLDRLSNEGMVLSQIEGTPVVVKGWP